MAKYQRRPIEAWQFDGTLENARQIANIVEQTKRVTVTFYEGKLALHALANTMSAEAGDWIVLDGNSCWVCKPDIFAATYEELNETL